MKLLDKKLPSYNQYVYSILTLKVFLIPLSAWAKLYHGILVLNSQSSALQVEAVCGGHDLRYKGMLKTG